MKRRTMKCLIWDLDETLWQGTLAEGDHISLRSDVKAIILELDRRGILHSIASRNDPKAARDALVGFGLEPYFLYPEIGWGAKSLSVERIAKTLQIGLDAVAFIDDQPFELEEVRSRHSQVMCLSPAAIPALRAMPEFTPDMITPESGRRRAMYLEDQARRTAERAFEGPAELFLSTLGMRMAIFRAREKDLARASELTVRTHQLNTTGRPYSAEELGQLCHSNRHRLYCVELSDRFGAYGIIGIALLECTEQVWTIRLFLMSCRVVSRGVGTIFINYIMRCAKQAQVQLVAEMIPSERNRLMQVAYAFAGFRLLREETGGHLLVNDLSTIQDTPGYVNLDAESA